MNLSQQDIAELLVILNHSLVEVNEQLAHEYALPLAREATGQKPDRLPAGQLREWHWRALAEAWKARPEGLNNEWGGDYGRIGWNTWLRLRDYKVKGEERPLVEEYTTYKQVQRSTHGESWTESRPVYWLRLTPFGEQFYYENWQRYRELYPNVEAPEP